MAAASSSPSPTRRAAGRPTAAAGISSTLSRAPTSASTARPARRCSTSTSPSTLRARTTRVGRARSRPRRTGCRWRSRRASSTSPPALASGGVEGELHRAVASARSPAPQLARSRRRRVSSACVSGVWPEINAATRRSLREVVGDQPFLEVPARDDAVVACGDVAEQPELDPEDLGEEVGDLVERASARPRGCARRARPGSARSSSAGSRAAVRPPDRRSSRGRRPRRRSRTLVRRYSSTTTAPRSSAMPAPARYAVAGSTPTPTIASSASIRRPSRVVAWVRRPSLAVQLGDASPRTSSTPRLRYSCSSVLDNSGCASAAKSRSPGSITVTSRPRLRSEAAVSMPMKPAPTTSARPAVRGRVVGPRARRRGPVGEDALEVLARESRAAAGVEPAREHEPVVADLLAAGERDRAGCPGRPPSRTRRAARRCRARRRRRPARRAPPPARPSRATGPWTAAAGCREGEPRPRGSSPAPAPPASR